jgi:hypothetical protein
MHREVREELLDLARTERTGIPAIMKTNVALQPLEIRLLSAQARWRVRIRSRAKARSPALRSRYLSDTAAKPCNP